VLNALYGTLKVGFTTGPGGEMVTREFRAPDGYWFGGSEWKHSAVSGVLIARSLHVVTAAVHVPTLWEHPAPDKPVEPALMWRRALAMDRELTYVDEMMHPRDVLGLPEGWPPGEPFEPYPS
jgi:hypothetical protein